MKTQYMTFKNYIKYKNHKKFLKAKMKKKKKLIIGLYWLFCCIFAWGIFRILTYNLHLPNFINIEFIIILVFFELIGLILIRQ